MQPQPAEDAGVLHLSSFSFPILYSPVSAPVPEPLVVFLTHCFLATLQGAW